MSRATGRPRKTDPPQTLEQKIDALTDLVRGITPAGPSADDLRRLRWWAFAMGAVVVAALTVAAAAVAFTLTSG